MKSFRSVQSQLELFLRRWVTSGVFGSAISADEQLMSTVFSMDQLFVFCNRLEERVNKALLNSITSGKTLVSALLDLFRTGDTEVV